MNDQSAPVAFQTSYEVTPGLGARFYRAALWNQQGEFVILSVLMAAIAIWAILGDGQASFWAFWLGVASTYWYGWLMGLRTTRALSTTDRGPITLRVDDNGCSFESMISSTWFAWSDVRRIYRLKPGLSVERRNGSNPIPIPASALSDLQMTAMLELATRAGAEVR